jgi:hypothetical protein
MVFLTRESSGCRQQFGMSQVLLSYSHIHVLNRGPVGVPR